MKYSFRPKAWYCTWNSFWVLASIVRPTGMHQWQSLISMLVMLLFDQCNNAILQLHIIHSQLNHEYTLVSSSVFLRGTLLAIWPTLPSPTPSTSKYCFHWTAVFYPVVEELYISQNSVAFTNPVVCRNTKSESTDFISLQKALVLHFSHQKYTCMCVCVCVCVYLQGVPGGMCHNSGGCSLC
jgi:hypothetical protein